jgi:hypothetical protein
MKNLLLVLLLANILYFMWGFFADSGSEPGIAIVDESDLGPPLAATANRDAEAAASVGAVLGSGEPSDLEALVGRTCVTVGPFRSSEDAERARAEYSGDGMRTAQRSGQGQIFIGHSVQVIDVPTRDEGRAMLAKLHESGLGDAFLVGNEEDGLAISLGIGSIVDKHGEDKVLLREAATCPQSQ